MSPVSPPPRAVRSYCSRCRNDTNHVVLHEEARHATPENTANMQIDFYDEDFQILECRGCESLSFRQVVSCSEDLDSVTGNPAEMVTEYPGRPPVASAVDPHQAKPFLNVAPGPRRIYRETVEAFNRELYTLAAGGLRATIEAICADQKIPDGPVEVVDKAGVTRTERRSDLRGKIYGMAEKDVLTKKHAETLHEHRFLGNNALHELRTPNPDDLLVAIVIVEHTFETIYELEHKRAALSRSRTAVKTP